MLIITLNKASLCLSTVSLTTQSLRLSAVQINGLDLTHFLLCSLNSNVFKTSQSTLVFMPSLVVFDSSMNHLAHILHKPRLKSGESLPTSHAQYPPPPFISDFKWVCFYGKRGTMCRFKQSNAKHVLLKECNQRWPLLF